MKNVEEVKEKNVKNNNRKLVIKDKSKFLAFISIALIVIGVCICFIVSVSKVEIDDNTNISSLNVDKYSEEIKKEYEQEGKDSKFIEDWNNVQKATGIYLIENYPTDNTQVETFFDSINEILNSNNWENLNLEKPTMWNGTWNIDKNGNVSFKFASKEIQPNWANTLSDQGYITLY